MNGGIFRTAAARSACRHRQGGKFESSETKWLQIAELTGLQDRAQMHAEELEHQRLGLGELMAELEKNSN